MGRTLCFILLLSASVYIGSADKCEDKYPECGVLAADGGCAKDFVVKDCPASCSAESGCKKNLKADNFYSSLPAEGECNLQSVSGGLHADSKPECKNWCPQCIEWANQGECKRTYVFDKCRLACDERCNTTCIDVCPPACHSWKAEGRCGDPWVLAQCQKSCNPDCWPTPTIPPTTPTTIDCTDDCIPACQDWFNDKTWDMCANPRFAKVCPAECDDRCHPTPPTTQSPPNGRCDNLCTDVFGQFAIPNEPTKWCHCSNWLGYVKDCPNCDNLQGHPLCKHYAHTVFDPSKGQCDWPEKSCKHRNDCPYTAVEAVAVEAKEVQKREPADCKFWAENNGCFWSPNCGTCDWQEWVCDNCPYSCNQACQSSGPPPPNPTNDKFADCKFWAKNGDCHEGPNCGTCDWQIWVAANCPTSCAAYDP